MSANASIQLSYEDSLHQYLYQPLSYIDISWFAHIPHADNVLHIDGWRQNPRLNLWLVNTLGLDVVKEADFSHPARSIGLLPATELMLLFHYIGATLHSQACKGVIFRVSRQALLLSMGEETYHFCMNQTQLLLSSWPQKWVKSLPEIIPDNYFIACGIRFTTSIFETSQLDFIQALQLKLPYDFKQYFVTTDEVSTESNVIAYQLIKKISKRVIPQCFHLLR
ncbi:SctK family type III secretion system sorting platform protein [Shewanella sp. VB17]|uniref:SctK family type III secretion system sorting platform protein n=1 Tax=Shewanella sp. VB17 TaxID=2739432 RepID=UPI0015654590|nr:SctK family type III secretion system sorting platform protein [Shewanella sp. VB17]NRD71729.1 SctK family type III secretion system sorting platform protein [Shewanella sp. VB17]